MVLPLSPLMLKARAESRFALTAFPARQYLTLNLTTLIMLRFVLLNSVSLTAEITISIWYFPVRILN